VAKKMEAVAKYPEYLRTQESLLRDKAGTALPAITKDSLLDVCITNLSKELGLDEKTIRNYFESYIKSQMPPDIRDHITWFTKLDISIQSYFCDDFSSYCRQLSNETQTAKIHEDHDGTYAPPSSPRVAVSPGYPDGQSLDDGLGTEFVEQNIEWLTDPNNMPTIIRICALKPDISAGDFFEALTEAVKNTAVREQLNNEIPKISGYTVR
jgi:hypothetical protein